MRCYTLRNKQGLALIAVALVLGGCGGMPKNAEEFRQHALQAKSAGLGVLGASVETFEVARPFQEVSSTLQKKAGECLNVAVKWTASSGLGSRSGVNTYKPTFVANSKRAELHVQFKRSGVVEVGSPPEGPYRIVLDATPLAAKRTRIDMYTMSMDDNLLRKALRGWAQGDNLGCPDLTKR